MIGIIIPANLKYAPYVEYYINKLKKDNIDFEIISWNRRGINENVHHSFNYYVKDSNRLKVYTGYFLYSLFVKRIVESRKYTSLIVFTIAGAYAIKSILKSQYKGKYIFDIRDDSPVVKKFPNDFKEICENAYQVIVSSSCFKEWINRESIICHNCSKDSIFQEIDFCDFKGTSERNIVFAGMLNEQDINIELIKLLKNNMAYKMFFIGTDCVGKQKVFDYVKTNNIKNVFFEGTYDKKNITKIYREKASYVNCIRKESKVNSEAVPNKLYDAVIAGKPIIVMKHNKIIAEYVDNYKLGIVLEKLELDEIENKISIFNEMINNGTYKDGRKNFLEDVYKEIIAFEQIVEEFYLKFNK